MKKLISLVLCLAILTAVLVACGPTGCAHRFVEGTCTLCNETDPKYTPAQGSQGAAPCAHVYVDGTCTLCQAVDQSFVAPTGTPESSQLSIVGGGKYLLADANGNYGGTLNRGKYGDGAPLNGRYDDQLQQYYTRNDFYNMQSTKMEDGTIERTIYTGFAPYQQTMANSGAMAGMVAVLNYWGETVTTETELQLVQKYEQVNATDVAASFPTAQGLVNLWTELGYTATLEDHKDEVGISTTNRNLVIERFRALIEPRLDAGKMVFLRFQDSTNSNWKVVVGYDNMGTLDWNYDDVIIFADSNDCWDHYQDGYSISAAGRFTQWFMTVNEAGKQTNICQMVVVEPKVAPTITRILGSEDPTQIAQEVVPTNNIIRNWGQTETLPEGSYGGTMNESLYGGGAQLNGKRDSLDRNCHKFVDYYNLTSNDTRLVLTGYRGFTQTHASSCGPCAIFSITTYYGYDRNVFHEEAIVKKYQEVTGDKVKGKGTNPQGLKAALETWGLTGIEINYLPIANWADRPFETYQEFVTYVKKQLSKGNPMAIAWRPCGGHWETIFGYDDMGTPDFIYDDVILLADSGDTWDHYQDGYNVHPATIILRNWFALRFVNTQSFIVIDREANRQFEVANTN